MLTFLENKNQVNFSKFSQILYLLNNRTTFFNVTKKVSK